MRPRSVAGAYPASTAPCPAARVSELTSPHCALCIVLPRAIVWVGACGSTAYTTPALKRRVHTPLGRRSRGPSALPRLTSNPFHQPALLQTIGQSAGAMVANEEPVGQRAYGRPVGVVGCADGQQELVLLRLQPLGVRGLFAEMEKAANLAAKISQRSIIGDR